MTIIGAIINYCPLIAKHLTLSLWRQSLIIFLISTIMSKKKKANKKHHNRKVQKDFQIFFIVISILTFLFDIFQWLFQLFH